MTKTMKNDNARKLPGALGALVLALVLAGCSTAPEVPRAAIDVPTAYKEAAALEAEAAGGRFKPAQPAEATARGAWWTAFNDPQLDALQAQAEAANANLAVAAARVKAARALLRGVEADRWPQLNASFGATRQKTSALAAGLPEGTNVPPATLWQAGLAASYEVDLFGRVANAVEAGRADVLTSEANFRSVLLALQADVAQAYFQLRALDAEVDLLERTAGLRDENVRLTDKRYSAGDISELDLARARTEAATTRAEALARRGDRAQVEHGLALLLGKTPAAFSFERKPLTAEVQVPQIPAGLPSTLLERRPDVAAAQAQLMAATSRVGQARSAIFPALTLTANGGYASSDIDDLFKWDLRTWLVNAVLSMPIIDGGRNRAAVTRAEAALDESVASYRQSVLAAFGDVENSLSGLRSVRAQAEELNNAVTAARRASDLADKRYRAGEDSYLTLIDTQRNLLAIERQAVQLRGAWAVSTVGLIRALGGGWEAPPTQAVAAAPKN